MVPLCWLTVEKYNFCTYILTGAPNSPPIHADWKKMQFLYLHCQWCSKWSPYTCWLAKGAIYAPNLLLLLQMVPLYRLTGEKVQFLHLQCQWCSKWSPIHADWQEVQFLYLHCQWCCKWSPYTLLYRLTEEKCNFCTYFVTGALWLLRLTFWPHFTTGLPNGPL